MTPAVKSALLQPGCEAITDGDRVVVVWRTDKGMAVAGISTFESAGIDHMLTRPMASRSSGRALRRGRAGLSRVLRRGPSRRRIEANSKAVLRGHDANGADDLWVVAEQKVWWDDAGDLKFVASVNKNGGVPLATHIAGLSPGVALALVAEIRRLRMVGGFAP